MNRRPERLSDLLPGVVADLAARHYLANGAPMTTTDHELQHAEQQMLMARPWDAAPPQSLWEITGAYPGGKHSFTGCLAVTLPEHVTGSERPLFVFVGVLARLNDPVDPAWITHARPLLLVHRDQPGTAYWVDDQRWLTDGAA